MKKPTVTSAFCSKFLEPRHKVICRSTAEALTARFVFAVFCLGFVPSVLFAQAAENTLVVVNADSANSLAVANLYIDLRDIPAANVVYIKNVPRTKRTSEDCAAANFKKGILTPILNAMKKRGIADQIDCIAYSSDFPTRIYIKGEIDSHLKRTGKKASKTLHSPWASITSVTYFYRNVFSEDPDFFALDANNFANPRKMKVLADPFSGATSDKFKAAAKNMGEGNLDQAIETFRDLNKAHPEQMSVTLLLARCFSLKGETDSAIQLLDEAQKLGFASRSLITGDSAFANLRSDSGFKKIVKAMEDLPDGVPPSRTFSSGKYWAKNGWSNGTAEQGERYTLSSVLAVTRKNQSTLEASLERLRSSRAVDGTEPKGDVYFANTKDVRARVRSRQFKPAKKELEGLGHEAIVGTKIHPIRNTRVIGATLGSAYPKWNQSGSKFLPGAICDNFTSFGGWWANKNQTKLSVFLDAGAAGASGTVFEPYAVSAKFPTARWHAHYARGCTLVESFFQSVSGPSQLLLVGDPLCCPFGKFPKFKISGLHDGASVTDDLVLQIKAQAGSPNVEHYELFVDGVFQRKVLNPDSIEFTTDTLADGYHEISIVGVTNSSVMTRRSEKVSFNLHRRGQAVSLKIENPECPIGQALRGQVVSSIEKHFEIQQNGRTIAIVDSGKDFSIPTLELGLGPTNLQAVAVLPDGQTISSEPASVLLVPLRADQE